MIHLVNLVKNPVNPVLFKIVELQADGIGAGPLEAVENARDFAVTNAAWGFNEDGLFNALTFRKIQTGYEIPSICTILQSFFKDRPEL